MKLKSICLPGMLALGAACLAQLPTAAQSVTVPVAETPTAEVTPLPIDLKLNANQKAAIAQISEFALDQLESLITSGLDPQQIDRNKLNRRVEDLRKVLPAARPDAEQLGQLGKILRTAREQIDKQLETGLPSK